MPTKLYRLHSALHYYALPAQLIQLLRVNGYLRRRLFAKSFFTDLPSFLEDLLGDFSIGKMPPLTTLHHLVKDMIRQHNEVVILRSLSMPIHNSFRFAISHKLEIWMEKSNSGLLMTRSFDLIMPPLWAFFLCQR